MKNLEKLNVQELGTKELKSVEGGVSGENLTPAQQKAYYKACQDALHQAGDFIRGFIAGF